MKNNLYKNIRTLCLLLGIVTFSALTFTSCEDDNEVKETGAPLAINRVYLEDAQSAVPDRLVEFARLGQTIRLEGTGFLGVKKVYINGFSVYFNPVYMTDNNMIFSISRDVPTIDAEDNVRNTIRLAKDDSRELVYNFEIRSAAPTITNISHTLPQAGDRIKISGVGLREVSSVTFPGDVTVTNGIVADEEDGEWVEVTVPAGVSDAGGSITVITANGGAYSPPYFNFKPGLLQNFDDITNDAWSQEIGDASDALLPENANGLPQSQGFYRFSNPSAKTINASEGQVDYGRYWFKNSVWAGIASAAGLDLSLASSECGIQMDIYYEGTWNSGDIRFVVADGWGASRYCMIYAPWVEDGKKVEVENPGCWHTITLPFSLSEDFASATLADIFDQISQASYDQAGPWFENGDVDGVASEPINYQVYFDNIRIVSLVAPAYSDFDDEE